MLHISHGEDDLHLTGFTFDEVQVVSLEDDNRDLVPMSFDQHNRTLVLSMMRGMSYMPDLGLGRHQQGSCEFTFIVDHDIPFGLSYTPIEDDSHHMARLRRDRVMTHLSRVLFDFPLHPYTFQLIDHFTKGSEHAPRTGGTDHDLEIDGIQGIQRALVHMYFSSKTTEAPGAMVVTSPSPSQANVFSLCFLEKVLDYDLPMDLGDDTNGMTLLDTYIDEIDMIDISRILDAAPHEPHFSFDMFGVFAIDFEDVTLYDACIDAMDMIGTGHILDAAPPGLSSVFYMFGISMLEINDDDGLVATDIIHNTVSIKEAFDSMDPPLSFDTMSRFVTHFDDITDDNNDMSIFLVFSCVIAFSFYYTTSTHNTYI